MIDWHVSHSMKCRTTYRYCKLAVILKYRFYLEINATGLVNQDNAYRRKSEILKVCCEPRFAILKVGGNVISTVI